MKKKILVIALSLIISLLSIKVKADTISYKYEMSPNRINYYWATDGSVLNYCTTFSDVRIGTYTFHRCQSSIDHIPVSSRIYYNSGQFSNVNDTSKNWSVFYSLYMSSERARYINSVMMETGGYVYACNVIGNTSPGLQSSSASETIYGIYCPSVVMHGSNLYITVNYDDYQNNNGSGQFYFGMSDPITFVDNSDTGAVVSAINGLQNSINNNSNQAHQDSQAIEDTLTQDHNYNNNASENIDGQQDIDNTSEAEENLMDDLDFSGASNIDVSINPNASSYIWEIVNKLRLIPGVITLMTSVLGLGIIKMILNR